MFLLGFIISLVMGYITSLAADKKGKNGDFWFWIGFFFGLFGLLSLYVVTKYNKKPSLKITSKAQTKKQPPPFLLNLQRKNPNVLWYHATSEEQIEGPMSLEALSKKWKKGIVKKNTLIWNEELKDWQKLEELLKKETITN